MYNNNYSEMVKCGVAEYIDPVWTDKDGKICEEQFAYGRKNNIHIKHPEMCFCLDEVGANT